MTSIVFENLAVQDLYNNTYSETFAKLENVDEIRDYILPYVQAVIQDPSAYSEATSTWEIFSNVAEQLKIETPVFEKLDLNTSVCISLWFFVYH
jgi:hypothetical protein